MPRAVFLAPCADYRPGKEGTVYGAGHQTDFDIDDAEFVWNMHAMGKIALMDDTNPVPPEPEP